MRRIPADPRHESGRVLLGRRLARLRSDAGMTVRELSEESGVSVGYIGGIESGARLPSLDVLERLSGAVGALVSDVLAGVYPWGATADRGE